MIVLDASAWVDVLTAGLQADEHLRDGVIVPPHFDAEVVGTIRALSQRSLIDRVAADQAVRRHLAAPFTRLFEPVDVVAAWQWRESMSFTDAWYAALASRLDVAWVTADQRAGRTARALGVDVEIV